MADRLSVSRLFSNNVFLYETRVYTVSAEIVNRLEQNPEQYLWKVRDESDLEADRLANRIRFTYQSDLICRMLEMVVNPDNHCLHVLAFSEQRLFLLCYTAIFL